MYKISWKYRKEGNEPHGNGRGEFFCDDIARFEKEFIPLISTPERKSKAEYWLKDLFLRLKANPYQGTAYHGNSWMSISREKKNTVWDKLDEYVLGETKYRFGPRVFQLQNGNVFGPNLRIMESLFTLKSIYYKGDYYLTAAYTLKGVASEWGGWLTDICYRNW
jgi:hypothetical protein